MNREQKQQNSRALAEQLIEFIGHSPTPFHAVATMVSALKKEGFEALDLYSGDEGKRKELKDKQGYYTIMGGSSLVAFVYGDHMTQRGLRLLGTHTDSPCLKIRPNGHRVKHDYGQFPVEVYGGVILSTWFDRDLSLAGRVTFENEQGQLQNALLDFKRPLAVVPNLAIHLNRETNSNRSINPQEEMTPIYTLWNNDSSDLEALLGEQLRSEHKTLEGSAQKILGYDLCFYDTQRPALLGSENEFVASARLDNLLSTYLGLEGLIHRYREIKKGKGAEEDLPLPLLVCNDHEEVGSASWVGAEGNALRGLLKYLAGGSMAFETMMKNSLLLSADNAHGLHPNYPHKHEPGHRPLLGGGPVLKVNNNQRYATTGETGGMYAHWCRRAGVPAQVFGVRGDMGCGSTIGPLTSKVLGVKTLDVGVPTFAMHSIRELASVADLGHFQGLAREFFVHPKAQVLEVEG